jgi:hypothetical protein
MSRIYISYLISWNINCLYNSHAQWYRKMIEIALALDFFKNNLIINPYISLTGHIY